MKKHTLLAMFLLWQLIAPSISLAQLFDPAKVYRLTNLRGGGVLEIGGGGIIPISAGSVANMWPYGGHANQEWYLRADAFGRYTITNRASGFVLEVPGTGSETLNEGRRVGQWYNYSQSKQLWRVDLIQDNGSGGLIVEIINSNSNKHLTTDDNNVGGMPVYQANYRGGFVGATTQRWSVVEAGPSVSNYPSIGVYKFSPNQSGGQSYVMEVGGAETYHGASVVIWDNFNYANQQWVIQPLGNEIYVIRNRMSGLVLAVGGGDSQQYYNNGQEIAQENYNGGGNQQWAIVDANGVDFASSSSTSGFKILNYLSGQTLTLKGLGRGSKLVQENLGSLTWLIQYVSQNRSTQALSVNDAKTDSKNALSIFPNPSTSTISIAVDGVKKLEQVRIIDAKGNVAANVRSSNDKHIFDIEQLPAGMYMLSATDGKNEYRQKFVKQ